MDDTKRYNLLKSKIAGRIEGYESFLDGLGYDDISKYKTTSEASAALDELRRLIVEIDKIEI